MDNHEIKQAIDSSQKAQRNYDLSKSVTNEALDLLIYAAINAPSKQNETHFSLNVYTHQSIIKQVYNETKKFTLGIEEVLDNEKGEEWLYDNRSVTNSQILSNILFVYVDDEGEARGATHLIGQTDDSFEKERRTFDEQKNYSIGISVGELILTANLLGYKTGICSAMNQDNVKNLLNLDKTPKLLVGVGIPNSQLERTQHSDVLNKDVPEQFRTGELDEHWKFPTFKKNTKVTIDGIDS